MQTYKSAVSHSVIWQCWKGSIRVDSRSAPQPSPMMKGDVLRFWHQARELNRRTRALGRIGLATLESLIFDFLNHKTGRLDPTREQIATAAAISVRSVQRGIERLKKAKLLSWINRCIPDQDEEGRFRLRQISNAYTIELGQLVTPIPNRPEKGTWGDHPSEGSTLDRALKGEQEGESAAWVLRQLENETDGLAQSLARWKAHFLKKT